MNDLNAYQHGYLINRAGDIGCPRTDGFSAQGHLRSFLANQGLPNVTTELAPGPPIRDPKSGKFRHAWAEYP